MRQLTRPSTRYRRDLASVLTPQEQATLAGAVDVACARLAAIAGGRPDSPRCAAR